MNKLYKLATGLGVSLVISSVALAGGDVVAGKIKSASCAACHGAGGEGVALYPALAGKEQAYLLEEMKALKSGARANPMKQSLMQPLSERDLEDIAAYYAGLK